MGYEVRCDDAIAGVGEYTDQGIANASRSTGYKYNLHGAPRSPNSLSMASRLARRTASLVFEPLGEPSLHAGMSRRRESGGHGSSSNTSHAAADNRPAGTAEIKDVSPRSAPRERTSDE